MKRRMIVLTVCMVTLALLLAGITLSYDRLVDKARLEQVSKLPHHTAPTKPIETPGVPETTMDPEASKAAQQAIDAAKDQAPGFVVYDKDGNALELNQLLGKPVVLSFWTSWKDKCKEQMPVLQEIYDEYKDSVHILMINMPDGNRETTETAEAFIQENGYTFPIYYDLDSNAAIAYDVQNTPSTYFIDTEGRGICYAGDKITRSLFEKGLARCYNN